MVDGSEGDHDEGEGGLGGVEAAGAVDDEPDPAVEAFVAGVFDPEAYRGEHPGSVLADGLGDGDELFQPGAGRFGAEPVEQFGDLGVVEVAGEDSPEGFFQGVRAPQSPAVTFQFA